MSGLWQFASGPGSLVYRLLDALRRRLNRRLVRYLVRRGLPEGGRVLEAGSGPATATSLLSREPGVRLAVALDLDEGALREARRFDPRLPAVRGDVLRMPFAHGAFDLVWSSSTLEHLEEPDRAVGEMSRITRTGGCLFVGVPYHHGPLWIQREIPRTRIGVWLGPVFRRARLAALLEARGLRPEHVLVYFARFFIGILARKP